jgi:hypothetical protein
MNARRSLVLAPVLAGTAAIGFGVAKIASTPAAEASAARRDNLRGQHPGLEDGQSGPPCVVR